MRRKAFGDGVFDLPLGRHRIRWEPFTLPHRHKQRRKRQVDPK
jgi:hypothetical protein